MALGRVPPQLCPADPRVQAPGRGSFYSADLETLFMKARSLALLGGLA